MQTMGARGPGSPRPPAHSGAGPEGPGQTYRAPKLARNSSSARQLPACSPAAHGARPDPLPSPAQAHCPSASAPGCSSSFLRRSGRRDAPTADPSAEVTPPTSLRPLPPPLPRMLHRGERGPAAHGSLGDPALSPAPAGARARELWPGVTCYPA